MFQPCFITITLAFPRKLIELRTHTPPSGQASIIHIILTQYMFVIIDLVSSVIIINTIITFQPSTATCTIPYYRTQPPNQPKFKKKKTPAVKFLDLIFRNNIFIINFSKMCSR